MDTVTRKLSLSFVRFSCAASAIILPGGYGTLDEDFEMLTWNQLGHSKRFFVLVRQVLQPPGSTHYTLA
jgi:predicted Rossmann-fold nucleotide-binding protein